MASTSQVVDPSNLGKLTNYPLVKTSDMTEATRTEAVEMVVSALEKHANNYEAAARSVKEAMDKKFGPPWHVVVGEGFGFNVTYETKALLYMFFGGSVAIVLFKAP